MSVGAFKQAVNAHPFRPCGVKVGTGLWRALVAEGLITRERAYIFGLPAGPSIDLPVFDKNIFIEPDFDLPEDDFRLPTEPAK